MVSLPSSLGGFVGFLLIVVILIGALNYQNPNTATGQMDSSVRNSFKNIQNINNNQTAPGDWLGAIQNTGVIIWSIWGIIWFTINAPFIILTDALVEVILLPPDLAAPIAVFMIFGALTAIAYFLRRG